MIGHINSPFPFDTLVLATLCCLLVHALKGSVYISSYGRHSHPAASSYHSIRISCVRAIDLLILDRNKDAADLAQNREYLDEDRTLAEARESL